MTIITNPYTDGRAVLHCDCNCFFAAIAMLFEPWLRNVPLAICGSTEDRRGIVLTANYVAKKGFGIKTGMTVQEATVRCKELVTRPPDMYHIQRFSKMVREIGFRYTDLLESFGSDEFWLDVTGSIGLFGHPMMIAQEISDTVKRELGITVSIGVSYNKITAKLGSDYKKPDGITRIGKDNYKEIVYPLPVNDLLYVGYKTNEKLRAFAINSIGDLAQTSPAFLKSRLGKMGETLWAFANGYDINPVLPDGGNYSIIKSIGNSLTTRRDLVNHADVWQMNVELGESVATRMWQQNVKCYGVSVSGRSVVKADVDNNLHWYQKQRKLKFPTYNALEIAKVAQELFHELERGGVRLPLRSIGVRGYELVDADFGYQLDFFTDETKRKKRDDLQDVVYEINEKLGDGTVKRGIQYHDINLGSKSANHVYHPVSYFR